MAFSSKACVFVVLAALTGLAMADRMTVADSAEGVPDAEGDSAPGDTTGADLLEPAIAGGGQIEVERSAIGDLHSDDAEMAARVRRVLPATSEDWASLDLSIALERDLHELNSALERQRYLFRKTFNIRTLGPAFFHKAMSDFVLGKPGADFNRDGRLGADDLTVISELYHNSPNLNELSRVESEVAGALLKILLENDLLRRDEGQQEIPRGSLDGSSLVRGLLGPVVVTTGQRPIEPVCYSNRVSTLLYGHPSLIHLIGSTLGLSPCGDEPCDPGDLTGSPQGRVLIYRNGIADGYELSEGCIQTLGDYDPETGEWAGSNNGLINGKYASSFILSLDEYGNVPFDSWENIPDFQAYDNDFRLNPNCYDAPTGDQTQCVVGGQREAVQWSAQAQQYYFIDDFRNRIFNPIVGSLGFDDETLQNIANRQFRPDIDLGYPAAMEKPIVRTGEVSYFSPFGTIVGINAVLNRLTITGITRGPYGPVMGLPPLATAFDPGVAAGEYAGLMAWWVIGDNHGFPAEMHFNDAWPWTIVAALNDGTTAWTSYLMDRQPEVYRSFLLTLRTRAGRTAEHACGGTNYACDKGPSIRNVMMFDPDVTNREGVFPFAVPSYSDGTWFDDVDGPTGVDLAALFPAAIFYDISHEAGLGDVKANQIWWRTLYTIDDAFNLNMNAYGERIMDAVRFLWPDGNGGSRYENDVADVLTSRGIYVERGNGDADGDGDVDFRDNLPQAIGDFAAGTLEKDSPNRFGSRHPDAQPSISNYGQQITYNNKYFHPDASEYVAYQIYKHSKYGPCDELQLTDGTFSVVDGVSVYNNDGTFYHPLADRELGNRIVLVPGNSIRWQRLRKRCDTESEGYYAEDVRPFGFRVIQAVSNGFSIRVASNAERQNFKHYEVSLVDPSVATLGESTYLVEYVDHEGAAQSTELAASTETYSFWTRKNEPFTLRITRDRGDGDTIEFRERGNDFDRDNGNAFVLDLR